MAGRNTGSIRATLVLAKRYAADIVFNPALLVSCLVPLTIIAMLWFFMSGNLENPEDARFFAAALFGYAILFEVVMVTTMVVVYAMAEEREKHQLRTLLLAGVRLDQIVVAHGIAAIAITVVGAVISSLVAGMPALSVVLVALVSVAGALPLILASLAVGLVTHNQMSAMTLDTPFVILGLLPMFTLVNESMVTLTPYLPSGGLYLLTQLALTGNLFTPEAILPAASTLAWTLIAAAALVLVTKRASHET